MRMQKRSLTFLHASGLHVSGRRTLVQSTHRFLIVLGLMLGSLAIHTDPAALQHGDDIPEQCQANDRTQQGFQRGIDFGMLTVNQAWDTVHQDCRQLDRLVSILAHTFESLTLPPNATLAVQCRREGIGRGGIQALQGLGPPCGENVFDSQPMQSLRKQMSQEQ
jgi:hypothetical protein